MALELFRVMAGIDIIMAHYKGAGAATIDLLGGTVHMSNVTIQAAVPHLKTGRIRALGVGGVKRSALLPDVPTVAESGLEGYQSTGWRGIMGPAGIPAPIASRLAREVKTIVSSDDVKTHFLNNAMEIDYRDPQEFAVFIADEIKRWSAWCARRTSRSRHSSTVYRSSDRGPARAGSANVSPPGEPVSPAAHCDRTNEGAASLSERLRFAIDRDKSRRAQGRIDFAIGSSRKPASGARRVVRHTHAVAAMNPDSDTPRRSKRVADWLFSTDPKRRIRLAQTGLAFVLVIVCCGVMAYAVWGGFARATPAALWAVGSLGGIGGAFVAIRAGWSERLPNPSLTLEQIVWSIGCCAAGYVIAGPLRGAVFPILMVVLMFGMFGLRPHQVRHVSAYAVATVRPDDGAGGVARPADLRATGRAGPLHHARGNAADRLGTRGETRVDTPAAQRPRERARSRARPGAAR